LTGRYLVEILLTPLIRHYFNIAERIAEHNLGEQERLLAAYERNNDHQSGSYGNSIFPSLATSGSEIIIDIAEENNNENSALKKQNNDNEFQISSRLDNAVKEPQSEPNLYLAKFTSSS
jgi:hypothetical protein